MYAIFPSHTLQPRERIEAGFPGHFIRSYAQNFVSTLKVVVHFRRFDGDDLRVKMTVLNCCLCAHLRLQPEVVGIAAGQLILLRQTLCGLELACEFALLEVAATDGFAHFLVRRNSVAANRYARHILDATGHDHICCS